MRTIKELSNLTGISARMLRYYDQIGLLVPTDRSEAGYRLYDDKALETLQQILFFHEFDIPLKEIKSVMENPALDRNQILKMQRDMLFEKKRHVERLIDSIDNILKGETNMNYEIFNQEDLETLYESLMANMPDGQRQSFMNSFIDASTELSATEKAEFHQNPDAEIFHQLFLKNSSGEKAQKNFQKMVEWYGDKENALKAGTTPTDPQIFKAYQNRLDAILKKLAAKHGTDVSSFEVKEIIGEYDFVSKQLYQVKDAKKLVQDLASLYESDEKAKASLDAQYGDGTAEFFAQAVREFYKEG